MFYRLLFVATSLSVAASATVAQTPAVTPPTPLAASAPTAVPALIPYTGIAENSSGKPLSGEMLITFSLFKDEQGGEALWTESQTVLVDAGGYYKVQLGASATSGLPLNLFASGEGRWLEIQVAGQKQQARILLMSVPYAMKAADAETLGGLPASAYALAGSVASGNALASSAVSSPEAGTTVTTPGGTTGYLPMFTGGSIIGNSLLSETGTRLGIGITAPLATLDINGTLAVRGELGIAAMGYATSTQSFLSQPFALLSSAYNSGTKAPDFPEFQFQAEPTGNNTKTTGAILNLLYSNGGTAAQTGLSISSKGLLKFAPGQSFPGVGGGTITGVTAGTDLLGGGTSGNVTLNLDTAKVAQLAAANTFLGTQTITNGDISLPATASANSGAITLGGIPYLSGYAPSKSNVFVGNAGNFKTTGSLTTAGGFGALAAQTTGSQNTAVGAAALNTDTTGSDNTAVGYKAGTSASGLTNATAIGANAIVNQNNSLVLGNTIAGKPGNAFVNVGIGTDTPQTALDISVSAAGAVGPALTLRNPASSSSTTIGNAASIVFDTEPNANLYLPTSEIEVMNGGQGGDSTYFLSFHSGEAPFDPPGEQINMSIAANGQLLVGPQQIGEAIDAQLNVIGSLDGQGNGIAGISSYGGSGGSPEYHSHTNGGDGGDFVGGSAPLGGTTNGIPEGQGGNGGSFSGGVSKVNGGDGAVFFGGAGGTLGTGNGTYGSGGDGIYAAGSSTGATPGNAATLDGNVNVTGTLTAATKDFKIDDPADPSSKYLYHASVESSEMMDIYSGNVVTDELGVATVTLPSWFETLNTDFRYQLTTIGRDAHAWISQEVANGKFIISTNATGVKVSWQITAVRQDAYAKAHPLVVEQAKPASERGYYMHPELYGQPAEKQTEWGRHPEQMRRMQAQKLQQKNIAHPLAGPQLGSPSSAVNRKFAQTTAPVPPNAAVK